MHLLTREVSSTRRSFRTHAVLFIAACCIFVIGNMTGFYRGLAIGEMQSGVARDVQTDAACGITDPVACVTSILDSVTDLFRPEAVPLVMTVIYTATTVEEVPTCGSIMDTFHRLPRERLLEMPALLEQVADCKALYRSSSID